MIYFVDTWTNYFEPHIGIAAVRVLESAGFDVVCPPVHCCGRTYISKGALSEARLLAERNVETLAPYASAAVPIVGTEPSCILTLVDEYPDLLQSPASRAVARLACTIETLLATTLAQSPERLRLREDARRIIYHGHCYLKSLTGTDDAMTLLNVPTGCHASEINSGCCGMAGSFGHEHYDVAHAVGAERLFPAVHDRGDATVAASGFSCRQQILHHTGVRAFHPIELTAAALG